MRELERKRKLKERFYSVPALLLYMVVTLALVKGAFDVVVKANQSSADVAALQAKLVALTDQQAKLEDNLSRLNTEAGLDEEIKQKFNVTQEGERVAIIVDHPENEGSQATSSSPWYKRLWSGILSNI